jgi:dUTP pyrophosphatase
MNNPQIIQFNILSEDARLPTKNDPDDLCFDFYAAEDATIFPGQTVMLTFGLRAILPQGFGFEIKERSGLANKGIIVGGGEIDQGYRGEWKVILRYNAPRSTADPSTELILGARIGSQTPIQFKGKPFEIKKGDRVAQGRLVRMIDTQVKEISDEKFERIEKTARGERGFGSSGR